MGFKGVDRVQFPQDKVQEMNLKLLKNFYIF
jgi:hypothetical protein